jgi:DNA-binding PadR family transcriptional regulator
MMRDMEEKGYVDSYKGTVSRGPKRRMYRLTPNGKIQLSRWIEDLKKTRDEINRLVALYRKQVMTSGHGSET